jgi:hypothetical protein
MPKFIIKVKDKYVEWSTVSDSPTSYLMTREEAIEYGIELERLERCDARGTSSFMDWHNLRYALQSGWRGVKTEEDLYNTLFKLEEDWSIGGKGDRDWWESEETEDDRD